MFTRQQLYDIFETSSGFPNRFCCVATNGDGSANSAHIEGTTCINGELRIVLNTNTANPIRVIFTVFLLGVTYLANKIAIELLLLAYSLIDVLDMIEKPTL